MPRINIHRTYESPEVTHPRGRGYKRLSDVSFAAPGVGWAVGAGQLLYTRDGGLNWHDQCPPSLSLAFSPSRVFAATQRLCWVVGASSPDLCYTTDGGLSWYLKKLQNRLYPRDVFFTDASTGWVVADNGGDAPAKVSRIYFTQDSGKTWVPKTLDVGGAPRKIRFLDSRRGWLLADLYGGASGGHCKLCVTKDGGRSWETVAHFDQIVLGFFVESEERLFVYGVDGFVSETADGGRTWRRVGLNVSEAVNDMSVSGDTYILVCDAGVILYSLDKGQTWQTFAAGGNPGNYVALELTSEASGVIVSSHSIVRFTIGEVN